MNYVLGFLLIALALLLFITVANNSWMSIWDTIKAHETPVPPADTGAPTLPPNAAQPV